MKTRRIATSFFAVYVVMSVYGVLAVADILPTFPLITRMTTMAGFLFALFHAASQRGWGNGLRLLGLVYVISILFESVGVLTGWVYGPYHYTRLLGPLIFGLVPTPIPLAWFMMLYPALVIAEHLTPSDWPRGRTILGVAALGGLAMTAWDLVIDPIMVQAGRWIWEVEGAYYGIPLQNFWGWWLTTFVALGAYLLWAKGEDRPADPGFDRLPVLSYIVTGLSSVIAALIGGLGGPALAGFFAMIPWMVMGWMKTAKGVQS
ncbi:MAG: carotenoid biosynthesis protein [Chloroflexi bacterium]|nr:carotenoid biosynthesis protein [Chloroflexota bacterium]